VEERPPRSTPPRNSSSLHAGGAVPQCHSPSPPGGVEVRPPRRANARPGSATTGTRSASAAGAGRCSRHATVSVGNHSLVHASSVVFPSVGSTHSARRSLDRHRGGVVARLLRTAEPDTDRTRPSRSAKRTRHDCAPICSTQAITHSSIPDGSVPSVEAGRLDSAISASPGSLQRSPRDANRAGQPTAKRVVERDDQRADLTRIQ